MMHSIRPHTLFCAVKSASYSERLMQVVLPDDRTPKLLETALLVALARLVRPNVVLELGTGRGVQTLNLALAAPGAQVYTVDLDNPEEADSLDLIIARGLARCPKAFEGSPQAARIHQLRGDSRRIPLDLPPHTQRLLVYVDGGHSLEVVRSDTERALGLAKQYPGSAIAWHDYDGKWPEVMLALRKAAERERLYHIQETSLVVWCQGFDL